MTRGSTFFLKIVVILIGIAALAVCIFWVPGAASRDAAAHPETAYLQYPFVVCAYILAAPFFFALYQALKLLSYIDRNEAFSEISVKALKNIKYSALAIAVLMVAGIIAATAMFYGEDMAGVIAMGLLVTFASGVVATFAAVLQKLLQNAIDIKSENELTV